MRWLQYSALALLAPSVYAASWGFTDATVSVNSKSASIKERYLSIVSKLIYSILMEYAMNSLRENAPLPTAIALGASDSLKLLLTAQEGSSAKRPHQAFLLLKDPSTGLDVSYPFSLKDNGKSKVELVSSIQPNTTPPLDDLF
jgi:oligosaccharyltransferase complex subunit delta (ribophorin II)